MTKHATACTFYMTWAALFLFMVAAHHAATDEGLVLNPQGPGLTTASQRATEEWARYGENVGIGKGEATIQVQWIPDLTLGGRPIAAAVYASGDVIHVNSTLYNPVAGDCLWCAIFHEAGHLLGYGHGDGPYGLDISPDRLE